MYSDDGEWVRCSAAAARLRVTGKTIRKWGQSGHIRSILLPGNGLRQHRLYDVDSVIHTTGTVTTTNGEPPQRSIAAFPDIAAAASPDGPQAGVHNGDVAAPGENANREGRGGGGGKGGRYDAVYVRVSTLKQEGALCLLYTSDAADE